MSVYLLGHFLILTCLFGKRQVGLLDLILVFMLSSFGAMISEWATGYQLRISAIPDCDSLECAELAQSADCYRDDEEGELGAFLLP